MFASIKELTDYLAGTIEITADDVVVKDAAGFRDCIDRLAAENVLNENAEVRDAVRWIIREGAQSSGAVLASIHDLYMARGRNEYENITVPAINIRGFSYDFSRAIFRACNKTKTAAVIFEIAKSEAGYTKQKPSELTPAILAAAVKEGYVGPVFIQADHSQIALKKFKEDKAAAVKEIKDVIAEAIAGGYYNIDIDSSTVVDLSKPTVVEQQRDNFEISAELTVFVREHEPKGVTVSVGGEIGEVGEKNTSVEELEAYMEGYKAALPAGLTGLSKLSVQTGTTHGGVPLPDGSIADVKLDFGTLEILSGVAINKYGLSGCVQHGASTLPDEAFNHFPRTKTSEIHLATGFQNILMASPAFPQEIKDKMYKWLDENCAGERKATDSDEQFYYKTRKKAWGPFKRETTEMAESNKEALRKELQDKVEFLFKQLNAVDTVALVNEKVKPVRVKAAKPAGL